MALLADDDFFQRDLLPDALPRARGYAAPRSRLRDAVHGLEHGRYGRRLRLRLVAAPVLLHRPELHPQRSAGARQALGRRGHAGMDAAFAAPVPHLRNAARDQVAKDMQTTTPQRQTQARAAQKTASLRIAL